MFCGCKSRPESFVDIFNFESLESIHLDNWIDIVQERFDQLTQANLIVVSRNFKNCLIEIYNYYKENLSFHNHKHATEVFQLGVCFLLRMTTTVKHFSKKDLFTYCVALLTHDIGHQGYTNDELKTQDNEDIEPIYPASCRLSIESDCSYVGSESLNEMTHVILGNHLLRKHNITYNKDLYNKLIFYTDLCKHNQFINTHSLNKTKALRNINAQHDLLILLVKLADIGHILRPWRDHCRCVIGLNNERGKLHSIEELPSDTMFFNEMFVRPLILILQHINIGLAISLLKHYECNIQKWKDIQVYTDLSEKIEQLDPDSVD